MPAVAKDIFIYINSSNQVVTGATITLRAIGGSIDLYTYVEADSGVWPGYYYVVAPTAIYDIYINGIYRPEFSPHYHLDSEE